MNSRTGVINELHALYAKRNVTLTGKPWLRAQPEPVKPEALSGYASQIVQENIDLLKLFNRQLDGLDQQLRQLASEDPQAQRLMSIRGVGPTTAVAVSCVVGDIRRFAAAKKLASYFGLAPRVRQSAERERHGHISKEGNRLVRTLLIQAALSGTQLAQGPVRRHYLGVVKRRGRQIARVAAARKLIGVMFHLMKEQIEYSEFVRRGGNAQ